MEAEQEKPKTRVRVQEALRAAWQAASFPVAVAGRACRCWEGASIASGENEQDEQNDQLDHSQATRTTKRPQKDH